MSASAFASAPCPMPLSAVPMATLLNAFAWNTAPAHTPQDTRRRQANAQALAREITQRLAHSAQAEAALDHIIHEQH